MTKKEKRNIRQEVTDKIVDALESGAAPWVKPWSSTDGATGLPSNAATGKAYRGVNVWLLTIAQTFGGFTSSEWLTYNQAKKIGGNVRKGEKSPAYVIFWKQIPKYEKDANGKIILNAEGKKKVVGTFWFLKSTAVFNKDQVEGLPQPEAVEVIDVPDFERHQVAENVINNTDATIRYGLSKAFYQPSTDVVGLPDREVFDNPESFYSTAFHELGHWTGHSDRLDRDGIKSHSAFFGSEEYAFEELVAELTSAFLCAEHKIDGSLQHPEYLANWLTVLKNDNNAIFQASSQATKAADLINEGNQEAASESADAAA